MEAPSRPNTIRQLALAVNLAPRIIQEMLNAQEIQREADGSFDVAAVLRVKEDRARRLKGGVVYDPELQSLKVRREKAKTLKEEMELATTLQKHIPKADVLREWSQRVLEIKNALTGLGREVAPLVIGRSPQEVQAIIDGRVFDILRTLYTMTATEKTT